MTRRDAMILGLAEGLLVIPPVVDLATSGPAATFRYFAADAFYYFTVARNFARLGFPTFDQAYPTNGFHPLWQLWTAALYKLTLVASLPETAFLSLALLSGVLLVAAGVLLLGLAIRRAKGEIPPLFALLPVGVYGLLVLPIWIVAQFGFGLANPYEGPIPLYGTMWSYMNGMESGLAICAFGATAYAFVAPPAGRRALAAAAGLATSAVVLARLDLALVVAPVALLALESYRRGKDLRSALLFAAGAGAPILAYLAVNMAYAGTAMPVSGAAKSTFPYPYADNLVQFESVVARPFGFQLWLDLFSRYAQMIVPAIASLALLWSRRRRLVGFLSALDDPEARLDRFLVATGVGVLMLSVYDLVFTKLNGIGNWYFPVSILWLSVVAVCLRPAGASPFARVARPFVALVALMSVGCFVGFQRVPGYHAEFARFYSVEAPAVRAAYGDAPPKLIEVDDGIVAFATGFPALSGTGLAADAEAVKAFRQNRQLELCLSRGYDRITTLSYMDYDDPAAVERFCADWINLPPEVGRVRMSVEYVTPSRDCFFVRLIPLAP